MYARQDKLELRHKHRSCRKNSLPRCSTLSEKAYSTVSLRSINSSSVAHEDKYSGDSRQVRIRRGTKGGHPCGHG